MSADSWLPISDEVLAQFPDGDDDNKVYYRLFCSDGGRIHAVEVQWFDESGYDQLRFVSGQKHPTRQEAEAELNRMIVMVHEHLSAGKGEE